MKKVSTRDKNRIQLKQHPIYQKTFAFSHKYGFSCILESKLEMDYFNLVHFCHDYLELEIQPSTLIYTNSKGNKTKYTPDVKYIDENGELFLVEIKYQKDAQNPEIKEKYDLIKNIYTSKGIHFDIVTENHIHKGARTSNLSQLQPCWAFQPPTDDLIKLLSQSRLRSGNIRAWENEAERFGFYPCLIKKSIAHKLLECDITQPWSELHLTVNKKLETA